MIPANALFNESKLRLQLFTVENAVKLFVADKAWFLSLRVSCEKVGTSSVARVNDSAAYDGRRDEMVPIPP